MNSVLKSSGFKWIRNTDSCRFIYIYIQRVFNKSLLIKRTCLENFPPFRFIPFRLIKKETREFIDHFLSRGKSFSINLQETWEIFFKYLIFGKLMGAFFLSFIICFIYYFILLVCLFVCHLHESLFKENFGQNWIKFSNGKCNNICDD